MPKMPRARAYRRSTQSRLPEVGAISASPQAIVAAPNGRRSCSPVPEVNRWQSLQNTYRTERKSTRCLVIGILANVDGNAPAMPFTGEG
jgi:hypothetical protein